MNRRNLLALSTLLFCIPLLAQTSSDGEDLCNVNVRRHASSVCRTDAYGHQDCDSDGSSRVCAYVIIYDNGVERVQCQTCTDIAPPPGPNHQDCFYVDSSGLFHYTCDSPIVISLNDGAYPLTGPENPVSFDLNADGFPEHTAWTAPDSQVAFLALDRNHNGSIDGGGELFGNHTIGSNGAPAANGFEALASFDINHDGMIDSADAVWTSLLLWTDRNHDGRSEPSELQPIAASPVTAISIDYRLIGRRDEFGNLFRYEGTAYLGHMPRRIYDVFFVTP